MAEARLSRPGRPSPPSSWSWAWPSRASVPAQRALAPSVGLRASSRPSQARRRGTSRRAPSSVLRRAHSSTFPSPWRPLSPSTNSLRSAPQLRRWLHSEPRLDPRLLFAGPLQERSHLGRGRAQPLRCGQQQRLGQERTGEPPPPFPGSGERPCPPRPVDSPRREPPHPFSFLLLAARPWKKLSGAATLLHQPHHRPGHGCRRRRGPSAGQQLPCLNAPCGCRELVMVGTEKSTVRVMASWVGEGKRHASKKARGPHVTCRIPFLAACDQEKQSSLDPMWMQNP
jgi:hypothetical protein